MRTALPDEPPDLAPEEIAADDAERGPQRRCMVTRERGDKALMLRFVVAPDGQIVPDLAARLPGRGMWLSARADVLERAGKRGAFAKATRGSAFVPPDLRQRIEHGLVQRIGDLIGFARRAGQAVSGFQVVREWLQADRVGLVVQASDGSAAERARLVGLRRLPVVAPLTAAQLGALFGRDSAVHIAIAPGRLAESIAAEAARLAGVSTPPATGGDPAPDDSRDGHN